MIPPGPPWTVIHCIYSVAIGGQEMVVLSLVQGMDRSRFTPRVLCFQGGGALAARFLAAGNPWMYWMSSPGDSPFGFGDETLLGHHRPAILHTHNPTPHQYGALAAAWSRVPILVHTKHGRNQLLSAKGRLLERIAGQLSDVVVPVSADAAEVARTVERIPPSRLRVIRNGIALPAPRTALPVGTRAVHIARLNAVKDQPTLLRAARLLVDRDPTFRLDLVGDGEERTALEALVAELQLGDHVRFCGFTDDVQLALDRANLFVLSSLSEGIALTLLEAMAACCPSSRPMSVAIAVVVHGETGYLVLLRDLAPFADAMARSADPVAAEAMGRAGWARVEREFSLDRTLHDYAALYDGCATACGPRWRHEHPVDVLAALRDPRLRRRPAASACLPLLARTRGESVVVPRAAGDASVFLTRRCPPRRGHVAWYRAEWAAGL
jgi:glycosyltransferase involved in cell wall biosynthesis